MAAEAAIWFSTAVRYVGWIRPLPRPRKPPLKRWLFLSICIGLLGWIGFVYGSVRFVSICFDIEDCCHCVSSLFRICCYCCYVIVVVSAYLLVVVSIQQPSSCVGCCRWGCCCFIDTFSRSGRWNSGCCWRLIGVDCVPRWRCCWRCVSGCRR